MANLIRLKQVDQQEFSGYIVQVTDDSFYPATNPSGYISSVVGDSSFLVLSGNLSSTGAYLASLNSTTSGALDTRLVSTGNALDNKISSLSGTLLVTNSNISYVSGLANAANSSVTALDTKFSGVLSGEITDLESQISSTSGVLNTKISTVSGNLSSRLGSLESSFAATGGNFVDISSNSQIISGTKEFRNRVAFAQIDLKPYSGNYSNPGGQNQLVFTQVTQGYSVFASGYGTITGDLFVTKIMQQNNIEVILASVIYTGSY